MTEKKEILEKKLEAVKKQINRNIIMAVAAIIFLVFIPIAKFENFMFEISGEAIIAFVLLIVSIVRGVSLRTKKEDIEAELSVYRENDDSKEEQRKQEKKIIEKEAELEYNCNYCNKKFKAQETLNKHYEICQEKKTQEEKETKTTLWIVGIIFFVALTIYFIFNNKINLIPLFLIGFIMTPFFDKFFNHHKKSIGRLKHFEINLWKKAIAIVLIVLLSILINWIIPECPASCNDNNSCTNDFCSKETSYKCMNTLKLNCNGNSICESGEYGTSDCPSCDDNNKCTADSYDVGAKKCINIEMKGCIK